MRNHFVFLLSILFIFGQCTIQKRLYNRGYHIEFNKKNQAEESIQKQHPFNSTDQFPLSSSANDIIFNEEFHVDDVKNPERIMDSTVYMVANKPGKGAVYVDTLTSNELSRKKKQTRLIGVGIPMIGLGGIAAGALSSAATAGANVSAVLFLSAVGWICAVVAAILLIVFIVFLFIPVKDQPQKITPTKSKLSKGERTGLAVSLILVGLIGMAFWVSSL